MHDILQYLKEHGEQLDSEIASGTGLTLEEVSVTLMELSNKGEVILCRTTRFMDGNIVEGVLCRVAGYFPPASPGRRHQSHKP